MNSSRLTETHQPVPVPLRGGAVATSDPAWDEFCVAVAEELDAYFDGLKDTVRRSPGFPVLRSRIREQVTGGKLLRPRLTRLAWRAFDGRAETVLDSEARNAPDPECVRLAASFELLHAALLVHDDVVDRDPVRRGRPTVGELYRRDAHSAGAPSDEAQHLGEAVAIIGGDLLLAGALRLATTCTADPARLHAVSAVVFDAVTASAAGELDDVLLSMHRYGQQHPAVQDILNMERLKTATYSFEAPLRAGALLAGANQEDAARLAQAGSRIGVAYQVVDDVLGTFGDPRLTGKSTEADLREGKATVLTAHGMQDGQACKILSEFAAGNATVAQVKAALAQAGAETRAVKLAAELVADAQEALERLPLPEAERAELNAICHYVLHRRK